MVRCNFLFKQFSVFFSAVSLSLFLLVCASPARAQNFPLDSASEDRHAEDTVSVRDLSIPPKAFENFQRGLQELQKHDPSRSIQFFNKAIHKYPQYYEAYYHLGVAQKRLGQDDKATTAFQTAINLSNGKYALAEYGYALLLCEQGKIKDAEQTVRYALELDQDRPMGEVVLGTVLLYEHRPDEAEKTARDALSLDPNTADAYLVLAGIHGELGNYSGEVDDLNAFLNIEPQSSRSGTVRGIRDVAVSLAAHTSNNK